MKLMRTIGVLMVGVCLTLGVGSSPASAAGDGRLAFAYFYTEKWLAASDMDREGVCRQVKVNATRVINDFATYYQRSFNTGFGAFIKPPVSVTLAQAKLTVSRSLGYDCSTEGRKHWHDIPLSKLR